MSQVISLGGGGGGGIVTINGDTGSATGAVITFTGGLTGYTFVASGSTVTLTGGPRLLAYTSVTTTPYVVLSTDEYLGVDCSGMAITIQLPNAPTQGRVFYIKDRTGFAAINNITVQSVSGLISIDGSLTFVMDRQYQSIQVIFDGTNYQVF